MPLNLELESALSKIRTQTSSSLPHQKAPANLLKALESTFKEQNTSPTPAAYFASLLTTLESTLQGEKSGHYPLGDGDILPAELYLLALVTPTVPFPIIRTNLQTILSLTSPLWPELVSIAPPLRSQLSIYYAVILALDISQLDTPSIRQAFTSIIDLCTDPRPKVRKKAVEAVRDIISSPPSPLLRHPYSDIASEWALQGMKAINIGVISRKRDKKAGEDVSSIAIHLLAFLKSAILYFPHNTLPQITASLLSLPRLGNPYLTQSAYSIIYDLFCSSSDDSSGQISDTITSDLVDTIVRDLPSKTDTLVTSAWIQVVGQAMLIYSSSDPAGYSRDSGNVWNTLFSYLESNDAAIRAKTADALGCMTNCVSPALIDAAIEYNDVGSANGTPILVQMISQISNAFDSLSYARAVPQLLMVISSLLNNLRYRSQGRNSPTAAEIFLLSLIKNIGELRTKKNFEYKEAADSVLRTAMSVLGPEVLLRILPLNLEPDDRAAGREPRAFLLPLLVTPHPASLLHFITYFVPLTERLFNLQQKAEGENHAAEAKVWSVIVAQIWTGLPAYCYNTRALEKALTPQFSQMLTQLLYTQIELRPPILKALKTLIESNLETKATSMGGYLVSKDEAESNLQFLKTQAENWFAVLFNVFGTIGNKSQGMLGDIISAFASIADEVVIAQTFDKVKSLYIENLGKPTNSSPVANVVVSMQDILILLIPYLPLSQSKKLFDLCLQEAVLTNKDNAVQKRAYKILCKLLDVDKINIEAESVFRFLNNLSSDSAAAARKDRYNLITLLLKRLSPESLHVIPSLIPEAVLGTKEPSEKARSAAFDLITAMGHKMCEKGIIKRSQIEGMDDDGSEITASIEEFLTMIAGGLAGATPHMISATITAISRLIFDFKSKISASMQSEIFTTHLVFLTSANREIVKSTLGFIKLAIHTLAIDIISPHMKDLVQGLLTWAHDHKNHFKEKVRHIFERMIRRFGWDAVYSCVGEEEETGKFLLNIKKRKDRAKRKKGQAREKEEDDEDEDVTAKNTTGDAFEDVLYGSESDFEDSDEEHLEPAVKRPSVSSKAHAFGLRIRADNDSPMDLLEDAKSNLTFGKKSLRKKPGKEAEKIRINKETGKMMIDDADDSDIDNRNKSNIKEDVAGTAYRETFTSADGFTRRPNGQVKFHKDTKKRRRQNEEQGSDIEMADGTTANAQKKSPKRREIVKLGQEFKAKRAGGDVKKGGTDPYAYLPLAQAAKGKSKQRISIMGKR